MIVENVPEKSHWSPSSIRSGVSEKPCKHLCAAALPQQGQTLQGQGHPAALGGRGVPSCLGMRITGLFPCLISNITFYFAHPSACVPQKSAGSSLCSQPCSYRLAKLYLQGGGRCIHLKEFLIQAETLLKTCRNSVGCLLWGVLYPALRLPAEKPSRWIFLTYFHFEIMAEGRILAQMSSVNESLTSEWVWGEKGDNETLLYHLLGMIFQHPVWFHFLSVQFSVRVFFIFSPPLFGVAWVNHERIPFPALCCANTLQARQGIFKGRM